MRVALLANLKENAPIWLGMPFDQRDELDSEETVEAILDGLRLFGHEAAFFEANLTIVQKLRAYAPDICFNIAEGHFGDSRESQVPALLEMLRLPYTGSGMKALALSLDKAMTKCILALHGLPTPSFQCFEHYSEPLDPDLAFPMFVKPNLEGSGIGINAASIVHNESDLRRQIREIHTRYRQPALVEHYVDGREITVGVIGNVHDQVAHRVASDMDSPCAANGLRLLPPLDVDLAHYFEKTNRLCGPCGENDLVNNFYHLCPAQLDEQMVVNLNHYTLAAFRVLGCSDVARVDFRIDRHTNRPYILEINPLPGLKPRNSLLVVEARAEGVLYAELINTILLHGAVRRGLLSKDVQLNWLAMLRLNGSD